MNAKELIAGGELLFVTPLDCSEQLASKMQSREKSMRSERLAFWKRFSHVKKRLPVEAWIASHDR
jgi:O-methyltransferase involved in polyketide biosynthesis